jgi:D-ribulokinase
MSPHTISSYQGITNCEKRGYDALVELGSTRPVEIFTAGGGSRNPMWTKMRERIIGVKTSQAQNINAAYGAALLGIRL